MGSAVVDIEVVGTSANIDAEFELGEGLLKDSLSEIASEEQAV